jgi:hypothetical protein
MSKSDHDNAVRVNGTNPSEFDIHQRNMLSNARNADICYGVGTAVAVTGIVLLIVDAVRHSEPAKSVTLAVTGNGAGVMGAW